MFPVVVFFSEPILDETIASKLVDSALNTNHQPGILCSLYVFEQRTAVAWLDSHDSIEYVLRNGTLPLKDGISCRFAPVTSQHITNTIEIYKLGFDRQVDMFHEWKYIFHIANCDPQGVIITGSRIFLKYPSCDAAVSASRKIADFLVTMGTVRDIAVRPVAIEKLQIIPTRLISPFTFPDISASLKYQRSSLTNLVQEFLSGGRFEYPVILDVNCLSANTAVQSRDNIVYIVCPSNSDAQYIASYESISLSSNSSLVPVKLHLVKSPSSLLTSKTVDTTTHPSSNGLILW
jgi:hypothetical protein